MAASDVFFFWMLVGSTQEAPTTEYTWYIQVAQNAPTLAKHLLNYWTKLDEFMEHNDRVTSWDMIIWDKLEVFTV